MQKLTYFQSVTAYPPENEYDQLVSQKMIFFPNTIINFIS